MLKKALFGACFLIAACCDPTKTYDSFTEEQLKLLSYLGGEQIIYDINKSDSLNLIVTDYFIGNVPPDEVEDVDCDTYYPAFGRASILAPTDTSVKFDISIKKSNDSDGIAERIQFMGYDFSLHDSSNVPFYDSILLRGGQPYYDVYELVVPDTADVRSDLIHRVYFNRVYGVIRFDRLDGRSYTLRK